jgi:hypothetical protein
VLDMGFTSGIAETNETSIRGFGDLCVLCD